MSEYYRGKVAVVTGAASGLGLGFTTKLLDEGALAVFMADNREEVVNREAARLSGRFPDKVFPVTVDVTVQQQVEALVQKAAAHAGHLDFIFNNAGIGMTMRTEDITFDIWRKVVDVNLMGVVYGTYSAIPIMRKQGSGHIVNTASLAGAIPVPYQAVYAATKSAVLMMTESLYYELAHEGLSFSVICPGNVATSIFPGAPPADAIPVSEAVDYIFAEMEKKSLEIVLPEACRDYLKAYRENRSAFDAGALQAAAERRENYRTKGNYY